MGNKREIAESRIPDLNTYMKVITSNFNARCRLFFPFPCRGCRAVGMLARLPSAAPRCRSLQLGGLNNAVGG